MAAVEGAEAKMDDADSGFERGLGRQDHPGQDRVERSTR
jgi:hypothetical protein